MHLRHLLITLSIALLAGTMLVLHADDTNRDTLGMDPRCYELYIRAYNDSTDVIIPELADSLLTLSTRLGDKKAEFEALILCLACSTANDDESKMQVIFNRILDNVHQENNVENLLLIYRHKILYYANKNKLEQAFNTASELLELANKSGNLYLQQEGHYYVGLTYSYIGMYDKTQDHFLKCVNLYPNTGRTTHLSYVYHILATYNTQGKSFEWYQKAYEFAETRMDTTNISYSHLDLCRIRRDTAQFMQLYDRIHSDPAFPTGYSSGQLACMEAFKLLYDGHKDQAIKHLKEANIHTRYKTNYIRVMYEYAQDWENAYLMFLKEDSIYDVETTQSVEQAISEHNQKLNNDALEQDLAREEEFYQQDLSDKQRIEIDRLNAESQRLRARSENEKLQAEKQLHIARANKLRELANIRAEQSRINASRLIREKNHISLMKEEGRTVRNWATIMIVFVIGIIMLVTMLYLFRNRRQDRRAQMQTMRINAKLRSTQQEAAATNNMKDVFIRNISGDVRDPLQSVLGMAQILCDPDIEITPQEREQYGKKIMHKIHFLVASMDDILNAADIQSGRFSINLLPCNIKALCRAAVKDMIHHNPECVRTEYIVKLPDTYSCVLDPRRVRQVLVALLDNACHRTTEGKITLTASLDGRDNHVTFIIADTGTSIPTEEREELFQDQTTSALNSLHLCKLIISKMNGHVWYDQNNTKGSVFGFDIPLDLKEGTFKA